MNRLLVIHKGEGKKAGKGKRQPPSYRTTGQVGALVRYALAPARQSQGKERVAGIVDGMGLGLADGEKLSPSMASFITQQLVDDVPDGRRKIRQVLLCLSSDLPVAEQVKILKKACRRYAARYAPGCTFLAILHLDHNGEDGRGLHAHLLIRNSNGEGRAIDWSRDDLKEQQGMAWAAGLDVVPTRGTGVPRRKNEAVPYPKSRNLTAAFIGKLTEKEIYEYIESGRLCVGRRNKKGIVTSVIFDGKRTRLSTARTLVERERRLADFRSAGAMPTCTPARDDLVVGMASPTPLHPPEHTAGRPRLAQPGGLGCGFGPTAMGKSRGRKRQRGRCAVRGVARGISRALRELVQADKLGRVL